jgi:hypothetical protein
MNKENMTFKELISFKHCREQSSTGFMALVFAIIIIIASIVLLVAR